ncbi:MAG: response regulator [Thiogranum sp.]|nr:response regulator [Thiogranum sp.]
MPAQKRALIVDDSRSARLVLRRMLEKQELAVDAVESAQLALEFLKTQRPDVIFLDHMMPGMDGFQAIRAIKNNPATATIPVLMYTSKGGDLYLGQARALGAVGVLPKTVAPAELYDSLLRLGLVAERRSAENAPDDDASERAEDIRKRTAPATPFLEPGMQQAAAALSEAESFDDRLRRLLDEQRVEIRKDLLVGMDTVSRQAGGKLGKELDERFAALDRHAPLQGVPVVPTVLLTMLLFASLAWNIALQRQQRNMPVAAVTPATASAGPVEEQTQVVAADSGETTSAAADAGWQAIAWAMNQSLQYDFDEIALDQQRIDAVQELLGRLADSGYEGRIVLDTHVGEFCLLGNQDTGFRLPPPELTVDQCEYIGNPVQPADSPAAHQSLRFANFLNSTPLLEDTGMTLEVNALPRTAPLFDYPPKSAETTSAQWNAVASLNNRVSVRFEPRTSTRP